MSVRSLMLYLLFLFFFFNNPAPPELYPLPLHDALPISQAQHQVAELAEMIEKRGGTVKYAIHPVGGRMPGHMNVLLAEANVPYDRLYDMEEIGRAHV